MGKENKVWYILSIILITYLTLFSYIEDVKFTTHDDLYHYVSSYSDWVHLANMTGRVQHFINGLYVHLTTLLNSFIYYRAIHVATIILMIFSFGWLINISFKNSYIGYLYMLLLATLWQNSGGHNMIGSYPFYVAFTQLSLLLAIIFQIKYIRGSRNNLLIISLFFWILAIKGSELWILYLPILILFSFAESKGDSMVNRALVSIKRSRWHIVLVVISLAIYVLFKHYSGGGYGGSTINIPSFTIFFSTWMKYTFGLLPGLKFYYIWQDVGWEYLKSIIDFKIVSISLATFCIIILLRKKIVEINLTYRQYMFVFIISLMALLIPNFLISLTHKYQVWADGSRIIDYLYSSLSYFVIVFFIFMMFLIARKYRYIYAFLALIVSILSLLTGINNKYIGQLYETDNRKFFILDAFLNSKYTKTLTKNSKISAPGLLESLNADRDLLQQYSKKLIGKEITFCKDKDANRSLKFINGVLDKKIPYMLYSENGVVKSIFLSLQRCNKTKPCYLIHSGNPGYGENFLKVDSYKSDGHDFIKSIINNGWRYRKTLMFEPKDVIGRNQLIAILDYDVSQLYNSSLLYNIEFSSGIYNWEGSIGSFVWSSGNVQINLINSSKNKVKYRLEMELGSLEERNIVFSLNGKEIEKVHLMAGEMFHKINLVFELPQEINRLDIITDRPAAKPGNGDQRKLTFSMAKVKYSITKIDSYP